MRKITLMLVFLLFAGLNFAFAQTKTINGKVTSADDGSALPGVTVQVKGTTNGTVTDANGKYSLNVNNSATTLVFSFVGMKKQEITISGKTTINVVMQSSSLALNQVVVTALGISRKKKALGYSVTQLGGKDVSTVKAKNIVNSLSGRVAGVVISESSSGPGGGTRVIIRGNNTLTGNNQPLYVVDGIPISNSGFGSANGAGTANYRRDDYGTGISDINPDDIASITILKGPNAAALYGSRASNGVILITTKKGRSQKGLGVSFTSYSTFEKPLLLPTYQNEYGQGSDGNTYHDVKDLRNYAGSWGAKMDGSKQIYWTGETRPYVAQPNNVKDFFRTGSNLINTLAFEGGSDKYNFRFSYTNEQAKGILPKAGLTKNNFDLRVTSHLTSKLSVDAKVTYFIQDAKQRASQGSEGIMAYLYNIPRNLNINDLKDYQNPDYSVRTYTSGTNGNPYWIQDHDVNEDTRNRFIGFAKVNYKFNNWLSFFARIGTDFVKQNINTIYQYGHWFFSTGQFNYRKFTTSETNADFLFMLNKQIGKNFHISANLGGNLLKSTYEFMGIYGYDFKIPTKPIVSGAKTLVSSYQPQEIKKVNSLYGSVSISYAHFIYLDLTGRNDWSSTLPKNNWSYFYPSVSLSLLLNKFIDPDENFLDLLKIRGSWAQVGGDTGPYQLNFTYNLQQNGYLGLTTLTRPSVRMNPDLKPEQTNSLEFGLDFKMFKGKLYGDFSYYNIHSRDLIMDVPVSASTGYSFFRSNVGEMTNKGIEFSLGGIPVSMGNFTWEISANAAHNKNKLVKLIKGVDKYIFSTTNSGNVIVQATVGGGYGDIYGTDWKRTGDGSLVVDAQGRPLATSKKVYLGNYQPDWTGGLTNIFRYKKFTLNTLIDIRVGGKLFSGTDASMDASGVSDRTLKYRNGVTLDAVYNSGTPEKPVWTKNTSQITGQQYWGSVSKIASNYVYSQTFVMLREVSFIYHLPKQLFKSNFINSVSIGIVGRNLAFLYKKMKNFDPISSYSTSNYAQGVLYFTPPTTRSIGFNINVKF